jgi:hypothetical protein
MVEPGHRTPSSGNELEQQLGPEYLELLKASNNVDPSSKDGEDIISMFDELDEACPD